MPKYYVRSGHLERIVIAKNPKEAAYVAINCANGEEIDVGGFYIDERGFRGPTTESPSFDTESLPEYMLSYRKLAEEWGIDEDKLGDKK